MDTTVVGLLVLLFFGRWRWSGRSVGIDPLISGSGKSRDPSCDLLLVLGRCLCSLVARSGRENRWILDIVLLFVLVLISSGLVLENRWILAVISC